MQAFKMHARERYKPMRCIPMRCTPIRCTSMRCTSMRCTPVRYTPVRCTPMRCTPMRCTPMRCIPVRHTPMRYTPTRGMLMRHARDVPAYETHAEVHAHEGFCEDLARQNTVAHLPQLQLGFRRCRIWVLCCRMWVSVIVVVP